MGANNFEPNYYSYTVDNKTTTLSIAEWAVSNDTISCDPTGAISIDVTPNYRMTESLSDFIFNKAKAQKIYDNLASIICRARGLVADGATIKKVIFNEPATVVYWSDDTKTVVKCQEGDKYDPEHGLAMCIAKKCCGNRGCFNEVFKKWLPKE